MNQDESTAQAARKFVSKPKEVVAFQWFENSGVNPNNAVKHELIDLGTAAFCVTTIHGQKTVVSDGDWIIMEPDGIHHYPCKPNIFETSYQPLTAAEPAGVASEVCGECGHKHSPYQQCLTEYGFNLVCECVGVKPQADAKADREALWEAAESHCYHYKIDGELTVKHIDMVLDFHLAQKHGKLSTEPYQRAGGSDE